MTRSTLENTAIQDYSFLQGKCTFKRAQVVVYFVILQNNQLPKPCAQCITIERFGIDHNPDDPSVGIILDSSQNVRLLLQVAREQEL